VPTASTASKIFACQAAKPLKALAPPPSQPTNEAPEAPEANKTKPLMWANHPPPAPWEGPPVEGPPVLEVLSQGPLRGPPQGPTPWRLPEVEHFRALLNGLVNLVPTENRGEARGFAKTLDEIFTK